MQIVIYMVTEVILRSISTLLPREQSLFEVYFSLFKLHARHRLIVHRLKPICHITLLLLYRPVSPSPSLSLPSLYLHDYPYHPDPCISLFITAILITISISHSYTASLLISSEPLSTPYPALESKF